MKGIIRTIGFLTKEIAEVVRQPSLVLVLILGPFLILFLFGVGHNPIHPPLRTVLVVPTGLQLPIPPDQYQQFMGPAMQLVETTDSYEDAVQQLKERRVDLVVALPSDLYQRLAAGDQASVTILYNEVDPAASDYIRFVSSSQVSAMNRQILEAELATVAQQQGPLTQFPSHVDQQLGPVANDLANGDTASAKRRIAALDDTALSLDARVEALSRFLGPMEQGAAQNPAAQSLGATRDALARFRADLSRLNNDVDANPAAVPQDIVALRADAGAVGRSASGLSALPPKVIAAPLNSRTENVAPITPDFVAFYAPAVLALLLQHIAVTFGALSIVRERLFGAMELFRVAPVSSAQMLIGKYAAYLILAAVVTVVLTFLIVQQLHVPFAGSYDFFAEIIVALILASLGIGFCISLVSDWERQAVQLAMLMLISSVFFSGFFLPLQSFTWQVRAIAYLLPVTYGIATLQDVMLRGESHNYPFLAALSGLALAFFILATILLRREMAHTRNGHAEVA